MYILKLKSHPLYLTNDLLFSALLQEARRFTQWEDADFALALVGHIGAMNESDFEIINEEENETTN